MRTPTAKLLASCALCLIGTAANASVPTPASGGGTVRAPAGAAVAPGPTGGTAAGAPAAGAGGGLGGPAGIFAGQSARFGGSFGDSSAGATVIVEVAGPGPRGWSSVASATADGHGAFSIRWRATRTGRYRLRARLAYGSGAPLAGATVVYEPSIATWFGPRGGAEKTACGRLFTHTLIGVAHRTLPCGTRVQIYYRGHSIIAPVVDRGPYTSASWDLTEAAARALGFDGRAQVGVLSPIATRTVARSARRHHRRHRSRRRR